MDNIYLLNYMLGREIAKRGGKLIICFVDLKAAFDMVDREKMREALKRRGVSEWMCERITEMYEETKCGVRIGEKMGESLWTERGVRQGCPLSTYIFNIYIVNLAGKFRKTGWGGIRIRGEKIYELAYAQDIGNEHTEIGF